MKKMMKFESLKSSFNVVPEGSDFGLDQPHSTRKIGLDLDVSPTLKPSQLIGSRILKKPSHPHSDIVPARDIGVESCFSGWLGFAQVQEFMTSEIALLDQESAMDYKTMLSSVSFNLSKEFARLGVENALMPHLHVCRESDSDDTLPPPRSPNRTRKLHLDTLNETLVHHDHLSVPSIPELASPELVSTDLLSTELVSIAKELDFNEPQLVVPPFIEKNPKVDSKIDVNEHVPKFYFPHGKTTHRFDFEALQTTLTSILDTFNGKKVPWTASEFIPITLAFEIPRYFNAALYQAVFADLTSELTPLLLISWFESKKELYPDTSSLIFSILKSPEANYLTPNNIKIPVEDVTLNHPGLEFLSSLPVFQNRYIETIVCRLFYTKHQNWNKKMTLSEFKKSRFVQMITDLEQVEDINTTLDIFSYQHFYVIYCRFWELDRDHDMLIDYHALQHYDGGCMTDIVLKRVMEGYGKPPSLGPGSDKMSYEDFIWFILSAEDKRTPYAIEYWFRCLDLDGDGVISLLEIQMFFEDQFKQMRLHNMGDIWKMDLVKPKNPNVITLQDLKKCRASSLFFDMLFDLSKYDAHVRRIDPAFREEDDVFILDESGERVKLEGFEKFAAKTYEILAREETQGGYGDIEDDFLTDGESSFHVMPDMEWDHDSDVPWTIDSVSATFSNMSV